MPDESSLREPLVDYAIELVPCKPASGIGNAIGTRHMVGTDVLQGDPLPDPIDAGSAVAAFRVVVVGDLMAGDSDDWPGCRPELLAPLIAGVTLDRDLMIRQVTVTRRDEAHPSGLVSEVAVEDQHSGVVVPQLTVAVPRRGCTSLPG